MTHGWQKWLAAGSLSRGLLISAMVQLLEFEPPSSGLEATSSSHDGRPVLCLRLLHHGSPQQGPHLALPLAVQVATQMPRQLCKLSKPKPPHLGDANQRA